MESFLEQALERYPELTVVDTSEGIALLEEEVHHHHDDEEEAEAHEHEQEHEHEGNSHIWLSPARAAQQAENIAAALSEMDQADAAVFAESGEVQGGNGCCFCRRRHAEFAGRHGSRGIP